jgi:hypothetical protein
MTGNRAPRRYSWSVVVDRGAGSPRESFKLFRPRREEDCSDEPAWEGTARLTGLGPGWHAAEIQVFEEVGRPCLSRTNRTSLVPPLVLSGHAPCLPRATPAARARAARAAAR